MIEIFNTFTTMKVRRNLTIAILVLTALAMNPWTAVSFNFINAPILEGSKTLTWGFVASIVSILGAFWSFRRFEN